MDIKGRDGKTRHFQNFCWIKISSENFLRETLFYSFHFTTYLILLVQNNFDTSILPVFVESGHGKHVTNDFNHLGQFHMQQNNRMKFYHDWKNCINFQLDILGGGVGVF